MRKLGWTPDQIAKFLHHQVGLKVFKRHAQYAKVSLDIMPNTVQAVMKCLPFYYELFCPVAIFLGRLHGPALAEALVIQSGWLLLTWAAARAMWKRGLGHYQAVGG